MNKKKTIILTSIIVGVLVVTLGLTYAVLSFNQTGGNSQLVLGDIYMHYNETKALTIENAMPGSPYSNYFEFTISGKNTYTKNDIYYDFIITRGDLLEGKIEDNRIPDKYLKFKLVSVVEDIEIVLLEDKKYNDLVNKRIYVETIGKNTTTEVNRTYRLYMAIDNSLEIGNSETAVFGIEEWKEAFASIKVNVTGDFNEKELTKEPTDESCFEYEINTIENSIVNPVMVNQSVVENELYSCVDYLMKNDYGYYSEEIIPYCQGTGSYYSYTTVTFQDRIDDSKYSDTEIQEMVNLNILVSSDDGYVVNPVMANQELNELTVCVTYFSDEYESESLDRETLENFCKGEGTINEKTFQTQLNDGTFWSYDLEKFVSMNIIEITSATMTLTSYDPSCGMDVVIPSTFDGYPVTIIGYNAFKNNNLTSVEIPNTVTEIWSSAFYGNSLTFVEFPENLTEIHESAFQNNQLTNINIPNSVIYISMYVFAGNNLTSVKIGNGIQSIGLSAFSKTETSNSNLESISINRTCSNIKAIVGEYYGNTAAPLEGELYPWLSSSSPYTAEGVTIYGSDGEVCDTF